MMPTPINSRLIDWFIPSQVRSDRAMLGRARIFVFTHLFGPLLGAMIGVFLYYADPNPGAPFVIVVACIAGFTILPFALKAFGRLPLLAFISFADLTFATLYGSYYYGGVSSPFLPWLLVALLLGFFYLGQRPWLVIGYFSANIVGFLFIYLLNGSFAERVAATDLTGVAVSSVLSATIYVSMMALYYATAVASQTETEQEAQRYTSEAIRLREATEAAERANRAKSVFLAKMSHQLRTPLNAVIGYSDMLLEDAEAEGYQDHIADLRRINGAGKHLLALLTDVLDVSAIEADRTKLTITSFDLNGFIEDVVATSRSLVTARQNQFRIDLPPELGIVTSDATRLRQIILNLLSNAGKFTAAGIVTLKVRRAGEADGDWLELSVSDTGIGISAEAQNHLFQNFNQAEASIGTLYGGTGLGLALSRNIARMLGGEIAVASHGVGRGSVFTLRLPAHTTTPAEPPAGPQRRDAEGPVYAAA